jgi:hypothetical protein
MFNFGRETTKYLGKLKVSKIGPWNKFGKIGRFGPLVFRNYIKGPCDLLNYKQRDPF